MSKTKDNVEGQSKEELDSQKEVSDKSESADKPYIAFEQIKSLDVAACFRNESGSLSSVRTGSN